MERFIENYNGEVFDIIIIGGGITGAYEIYDNAGVKTSGIRTRKK